MFTYIRSRNDFAKFSLYNNKLESKLFPALRKGGYEIPINFSELQVVKVDNWIIFADSQFRFNIYFFFFLNDKSFHVCNSKFPQALLVFVRNLLFVLAWISVIYSVGLLYFHPELKKFFYPSWEISLLRQKIIYHHSGWFFLEITMTIPK